MFNGISIRYNNASLSAYVRNFLYCPRYMYDKENCLCFLETLIMHLKPKLKACGTALNCRNVRRLVLLRLLQPLTLKSPVTTAVGDVHEYFFHCF